MELEQELTKTLLILKDKGIDITLDQGDKIKIQAPKGALSEQDKTFLKANKQGVLAWLSAIRNARNGQQNTISLSEISALTASQRGMWSAHLLSGNSSALNISLDFAIKVKESQINHTTLLQALEEALNAHSALKARFIPVQDGSAIQVTSLSKLSVDFRQVESVSAETSIENLTYEMANKQFLLGQNEDPIKVILSEVAVNEYRLLLCVHHIVFDGWSANILIRDVLNRLQQGGKVKGSNFIEVQNNTVLPDIDCSDYLDSILSTLAELPPHHHIPLDQTRSTSFDSRGGLINTEFSEFVTDKVNRLASRGNTTLFAVLHAGLNAYLSRLSGQSGFSIGTPVLNRSSILALDTVGFFANTQVLATSFNAKNTFTQAVAKSAEIIEQAKKFQHLPFDDLVLKSGVERNNSYSPLFQVMMVLQSESTDVSDEGALIDVQRVQPKQLQVKYDLTFSFAVHNSKLYLSVEYATGLFSHTSVQRYVRGLQDFFEAVVNAPEQSVSDIMYALGCAQVPAHSIKIEAEPSLIIDQVLAQAEATPEAVALACLDRTLSYAQMVERARQLASVMLEYPSQQVGIFTADKINAITAMLGTMMAGKSYVPIDPTYPESRINFILQNSNADLVLADAALTDKLASYSVIQFESVKECKREIDRTNFCTLNDPAYIIYTSGSTGHPKGVVINQAQLSLSTAQRREYYAKAPSGFLLLSSIAFDSSVAGIYWTLTSGGTLYLAKDQEVQDFTHLSMCINKHALTHMLCVPSYYQALIAETSRASMPSLNTVICAGETLSPKVVKQHFSWSQGEECELFNEYGPTEATVWSSVYACSEKDYQIVPIGKSVGHVSLVVLDTDLLPIPKGAIGELCITGTGISQGYYQNDTLTEQSFIEHPQLGRLYRTGDMVSIGHDDNLLYHGRLDHEIKLNGYRINTSEIERAAHTVAEVIDVCVFKDKSKLVCCVESEHAEVSQITSAFHLLLPTYLHPSEVIVLTKFPKTPNGKVDTKALKRRCNAQPITEPTTASAPNSELEQTLVDLLGELVQVDVISVDDNFFKLGGDSVVAIQFASRAKKLGINLIARDVFEAPTVAELARLITDKKRTDTETETEFTNDEHRLHPMQSRFLYSDFPNKDFYNQSLLMETQALLSQQQLELVSQFLQNKHPALKLKFSHQDELWTAHYQQKVVTQTSSIALVSDETEVIAICQEAQRNLSLQEGVLFKLCAISCQDKYYLFVTCHHIVVDAVSWRIILDDIHTLLSQTNVSSEQISPDWGYRIASSEIDAECTGLTDAMQLRLEEAFEQSSIPCKNAELVAPVKTRMTTKLVFTPSDFGFEGDQDIATCLARAASKFGVSVEELLLTATANTLHDFYELSDLVIDMEHHGRSLSDIDVSDSVGWFTHVYPVHFAHRPVTGTLEDGLINVKETCRNDNYRYNQYYWQQGAKYQCADVLFNYFGDLRNSSTSELLSISNLEIGSMQDERQPMEHKFCVTSMVVPEGLAIALSYSELHFSEQDIAKLTAALSNSLIALVRYCDNKTKPKLTPSDFPLCQIEDIDFLEQQQKRFGDIVAIYPATAMQRGMLHHSESNSGDYITQLFIDIPAKLSASALKASWRRLVENNDVLRAGFDETLSVQVIGSEVAELGWREIDLSRFDHAEAISKLHGATREIKSNGFSYSTAPMSSVLLAKLAEDKYQLVWSSHHALLDGWSATLLLQELFENYWCTVAGKEPQLPKRQSYQVYVEYLQQQDSIKSEQFWRQNLSCDPQGRIPLFSNEKTTSTDSVKETRALTFSDAETQEIEAFIRANGVTMNTFIQGIWAHVIKCYSGNKAVVFGEVTSGRPEVIQDVESMVGLFINTLPVVVNESTDEITQYLSNLQVNANNRRQFEHTSLTEIMSFANLNADTALFDSIIVFENFPNLVQENDQHEVTPEIVDIEDGTTFPLTLTVQHTAQLFIEFDYLKNEQNVERMAGLIDFVKKLITLTVNREVTKVSDWPMMSDPDKQRELALSEGGRAENQFISDKLALHQVLTQQATQTPDKLAITANDGILSYQQLNKHSTIIANRLIQLGVEPGDSVALYLPKSVHMATAIFAAFKAGATYVPLDIQYPQERIDYIINDAQCNVMLTISDTAHSAIGVDTVLKLDQVDYDTNEETLARSIDNDFNRNAYLIYTSGSTGEPKGVVNTHRNIMHYFAGVNDVYNVNKHDVVMQFSSIAFDIFVEELTLAIASCASLVIDPNVNRSASDFWQCVKRNDVSVVSLPTAYFHYLCTEMTNDLVQTIESLNLVIVGGEALSAKAIKVWQQAFSCKARLLNTYGPTEATIVASYYDVTNYKDYETPVPIGYPFKNYDLYVMSKEHEMLPAGAEGELWIGGECLALGYLNQEQLTEEKFVTRQIDGCETRLYRSGDIVRRQPSGELAYLGRNDNQVKIRGFRIELGEIESVIAMQDMISEVYVCPYADNTAIAAYIVLNQPDSANKWDVFKAIKPKLPEYMQPSCIHFVCSLPLTSNGKVDKRALPEATSNLTSNKPYQAPETDVELQVSKVWSEVLGVEQIGVDDSFFMSGGTSLKIARLKTLLQTKVGLEIDYADMFLRPTVKLQAQLISNKLTGSQEGELAVTLRTPSAPVLPACVYCFPGLGAFSHEFDQCVAAIDERLVVKAFNPDIKNVESLTFAKAVSKYAQLIEQDGYQINVLIGHSFGCVMAAAVGKELEKRGCSAKVVLLDYFCGNLLSYLTEEDLRKMVSVGVQHESVVFMASSQEAHRLYQLIKKQDAWMMAFTPEFNLRHPVAAVYTEEAVETHGLETLNQNLAKDGSHYEIFVYGKDHLTILKEQEFMPVGELINEHVRQELEC